MSRQSPSLIASPEQPAEIYKVGLNTVRFLMALGDVTIGWLLLRHAEVAQRALDEGGQAVGSKDGDFYTGKVASARFFAAISAIASWTVASGATQQISFPFFFRTELINSTTMISPSH